MHFKILFNIAVVVTLASFAFVGFSASALFAPPSSLRATVPEPPAPSPAPVANATSILRDYSSLFVLSPGFAIVQPEGTRLIYERDAQGRIRGVSACNTGRRVVLRASIEYNHDTDQIRYIFVGAHPRIGGAMNDSVFIKLEYDQDTGLVDSYEMDTAHGSAIAEAEPTMDDFHPLRIFFSYMDEDLTLDNVRSWDGRGIPIMLASTVANL
ncbi:hypothetical protein THASP1DRAFT_28132 [Thamnocephalis sphaerospora]|uniref:Uncharacterized protein n=1 Tax=Thamnocephalis sphaerospora TaxID=78915 RepID=A0A4P9XV13_9FUNG|nr:hypothetical protein THASP1DRAFT_28132 [Thamnocephalis sphaerospora]|eukprot:RKP10085.1 hypothetical protein THASP1DRAFT_28132 [Thamnocephalis sphaerospora]